MFSSNDNAIANNEVTVPVNANMNNVNSALFLEVQMQDKVKLSNTEKYWEGQYASFMMENTVILYAVKESKIVKITPSLILKRLLQLDLLKNLEAINALTNSAFFYLRFKLPDQAANFQNNTKQMDNFEIRYIMAHSRTSEVWGKIDGIPPLEIRKGLQEVLQPFAVVSDITPTILSIGEFCIETSPTQFKMSYCKGKSISDLPQEIVIGTAKAHLLVQGRRPLCFSCGASSHISKDCNWKFCRKCKSLQDPSHICKTTYASKLKLNNDNIKFLLEKACQEPYPLLSSVPPSSQLVELSAAALLPSQPSQSVDSQLALVVQSSSELVLAPSDVVLVSPQCSSILPLGPVGKRNSLTLASSVAAEPKPKHKKKNKSLKTGLTKDGELRRSSGRLSQVLCIDNINKSAFLKSRTSSQSDLGLLDSGQKTVGDHQMSDYSEDDQDFPMAENYATD